MDTSLPRLFSVAVRVRIAERKQTGALDPSPHVQEEYRLETYEPLPTGGELEGTVRRSPTSTRPSWEQLRVW